MCGKFKKRCLGAVKENSQEVSQNAEQKDKEHVYENAVQSQRVWTKPCVPPTGPPRRGRVKEFEERGMENDRESIKDIPKGT